MAKAMTQSDLASWGCQEVHEHDDECAVLYFHQRCHPDAATWTSYDKIIGRAIVECAECGREVIRFVVASD